MGSALRDRLCGWARCVPAGTCGGLALRLIVFEYQARLASPALRLRREGPFMILAERETHWIGLGLLACPRARLSPVHFIVSELGQAETALFLVQFHVPNLQPRLDREQKHRKVIGMPKKLVRDNLVLSATLLPWYLHWMLEKV